METFEISLIKSYIIRIKAKDSETAKRLCEFYTNDIKDISTKNDRKIYDFKIEEIECKMNEAVDRN